MRSIIKRAFPVLLAVTAAVSMTACSFWNASPNIDRDGNPLLFYDYGDYESKALYDLLDEMHSLLKTPEEHDRVLGLYSTLMKGVYRLRSQYVAASIDYDKNLYSDDAVYEERYMNMSALYEEITASIYRLYAEAYETEYEDIFFGGLTESEIEDILNAARGYDEEYLSLAAEYDELMSEYYDMEIVPGESDSQMAELYARAVNINNRIAEKFGYENYFDYCYDSVYGREYSPDETDGPAEYSVKYLIPVLEQATRLIEQDPPDMALYDYYYESALDGEAREALDAYFLTLGDKLNGVYEKFHNYELYVAASDPNLSYEVAFTDYFEDYMLPVCYFGPYYQDRLTVVHEMGHFIRAYLTNNSAQSYDAAELNSQGNEMLFLAYESTHLSESLYADIARSKISDTVSTILLAEVVNAFEYAVYTAEDIDGDTVLTLFYEACDLFGGYEYLNELLGYDVAEYWQYVVFTQPGYYISYAVSGLSALELYTIAMADYDEAVEKYEIMVSDPSEGLFDVLLACGMTSYSFEENIYAQISSDILSMDFLQ